MTAIYQLHSDVVANIKVLRSEVNGLVLLNNEILTRLSHQPQPSLTYFNQHQPSPFSGLTNVPTTTLPPTLTVASGGGKLFCFVTSYVPVFVGLYLIL